MSRPAEVRVAVVGVGAMGRHHAHNYLALPGADLVALVDPDPEARAAAEAAFGRPAYEDVAAMLRAQDVDAASVAAPTSRHHDLAMELLDAGVHVLVEKPAASTVADATALATRSREAGLVLQVGHITRFFRAVRLLDERVQAPYLVEARRLTPHARIQDVGVILDLMIHDIDIVLGLVPAPIEQMAIAGHVVGDNGHEDVAAAQITFADGCVARFLASRVAPDAERSLVVAERDRTFRVDFLREPHTEIAVYRARHGEAGDTHVRSDRQLVQEDNPLRAQLAHFLARIADGASPVGTLEEDLRSLRVAAELTARLRPAHAPRPLATPRVD